jgi:hypothetical protein
MDCNAVKAGLRVKTIRLEGIEGMLINPRHLTVRREGVTGTVKEWAPGHGGDVWFVQHDNSEEIGAYCFTELEPE